MTPRRLATTFVGLGLAWILGVASAAEPASPATLAAFNDEAQFQAYVDSLKARLEAERKAREEAEAKRARDREAASPAKVAPLIDFEATRATEASNALSILTADELERLPMPRSAESIALLSPGAVAGGALGSVTVSAALASPEADGDAITNVQTTGVDEGGIVKKSGEFLVVLRRGRLFTIRVNDKTLQAVSSTNAFGPEVDGAGTWYDEMLISGDTILVVGYSYKREATEVGLFHLGTDGRISYRATYQLFSGDYYSSRNSASRLIGRTLIFYSPVNLLTWRGELQLPGYRRFTPDTEAPFQRIAPADRIYRLGFGEDSREPVLHAITRCEIEADALDCSSTSVLGSWGSTFYVSRDSVFVWILAYGEDRFGGNEKDELQAGVVRIPLDGSAPTALRTQGDPIDQMAFLEKDGYLNVLLAAEGNGLRMWASEGKRGELALFRAPLAEFGGVDAWARPEEFLPLPGTAEGYYSLRNRYVGDWLLYGSEDDPNLAYALRFERKDAPTRLRTRHPTQRIEAMGNDALMVGQVRNDLRLSSINLGGKPMIASQFVLPGASQAEGRTHGFFYRLLGERDGLFGLPVSGKEDASVQFLRNQQLQLGRVGELSALPKRDSQWRDDGCVASCFDWYGDVRPIFIGERVYGLLGYELVEGELRDGRIRETRRVDFRPPPKAVAEN